LTQKLSAACVPLLRSHARAAVLLCVLMTWFGKRKKNGKYLPEYFSQVSSVCPCQVNRWGAIFRTTGMVEIW
jgi:predicted HD phosphohydrolase